MQNRALEFSIYTTTSANDNNKQTIPELLSNRNEVASKAKQSKAKQTLDFRRLCSQNFKYPTPVGQITIFFLN
jgi:hypothetical protein